MRIAICQCGETGTVHVQGPDYGRTFGRGAQVDLDAPVVPGSAVTWERALGKHVALFEIQESAPASQARAQRRGNQAVEKPAADAADTE